MAKPFREKSWRSQFMTACRQFIYKNKQSKNRRFYPFTLALFYLYRILGIARFALNCSNALLAFVADAFGRQLILTVIRSGAKNLTRTFCVRF